MHSIQTDTITRYIPSDLSECDAQQYIDICGLLFNYHTDKITSADLLTHAVYKLMNMVPAKTDNPTETKYQNVVLLEELIESSFFEKIAIDQDNYQLKIIQNYIDNPVPKFKPLWRTYHGPTNAFANVTIGEYTDALRLFLEFNKTNDINLLYELVATLYRPKKKFHFITKYFSNYNGDVRIGYNFHQLDDRIKAFKYAPIGFTYGVYLYFASMQIFVSGAEVPWGDKVLNLSILFSGGNSDNKISAADIGLDSVVFAMSESGAFGDYTKVRNMPFWTMMIKMYDARVKQLQDEKNQEDANSKQT